MSSDRTVGSYLGSQGEKGTWVGTENKRALFGMCETDKQKANQDSTKSRRSELQILNTSPKVLSA